MSLDWTPSTVCCRGNVHEGGACNAHMYVEQSVFVPGRLCKYPRRIYGTVCMYDAGKGRKAFYSCRSVYLCHQAGRGEVNTKVSLLSMEEKIESVHLYIRHRSL